MISALMDTISRKAIASLGAKSALKVTNAQIKKSLQTSALLVLSEKRKDSIDAQTVHKESTNLLMANKNVTSVQKVLHALTKLVLQMNVRASNTSLIRHRRHACEQTRVVIPLMASPKNVAAQVRLPQNLLVQLA